MTESGPLRIGFVGTGFVAGFHLLAFEAVRNSVIAGVYSPHRQRRDAFAERVNGRGLGPCRAYDSLHEMILSGEIDALWLLAPNDTRLAQLTDIAEVANSGNTALAAVACEKPLARNLAEARQMVSLIEEAHLLHGYLENQVFAPAVRRAKELLWQRAVPSAGRPYLVRAAEEHSGPHEEWFWQTERQGGGAMLDMMCHSVETGRFLLTEPGAERSTLSPTAAQAYVARLRKSEPAAVGGPGSRPDPPRPSTRAEDYAHRAVTFADAGGATALVEASSSWSYVGAGLRIVIEIHGPEYSPELSTLRTGLQLFLSRAISTPEGEDMVEKQNAEHGLMPVVEDEAASYGYVAEDRHMVESFLAGRPPEETFYDGMAVVELLMALYKSSETSCRLELPDATLSSFVPSFSQVTSTH